MTAPVFFHVLVDTGPLVAIIDRSDRYHARCTETLRLIQPPLWTTWPVLTEVAWLLRNQLQGLQRLYSGVESGFFRIVPLEESSLAKMSQLQKRFQTLKPQLADMTLLLIAEQEKHSAIFTLDRRDFSVMQKKSRPRFELLPETLD
ncbi:MAG: type II toxin-antitoxin system VapC family toxin [Planctomycetaceae bacterium]